MEFKYSRHKGKMSLRFSTRRNSSQANRRNMTNKLSMFNVTLSGAIQRETATATTFDRTESVEKRLVEKLYVIRIRSASLFSVARHFCLFLRLRLQ